MLIHSSRKRAWLLCPDHYDWYKREIEANPYYSIGYCEKDNKLKLFVTNKFIFKMWNQYGCHPEIVKLWAEEFGMGFPMEMYE